MTGITLFLTAFLASAVEMVEALTIVLAVGVTRGWRSALIGVASASVALIVLVVALGPAISSLPMAGFKYTTSNFQVGGAGNTVDLNAAVWLSRACLPGMVKKGAGFIQDHQLAFADSTIFQVFTIPMIAGDPMTALNEPNTIVIDEDAARSRAEALEIAARTAGLHELDGAASGAKQKVPGRVLPAPVEEILDPGEKNAACIACLHSVYR